MLFIRKNRTEGARNKARVLRRRLSVSEACFWSHVRRDALGFRVKRQVPVGRFVLDFFVPSAKVCIEIDGEQHRATVDRDAARDAFLAEEGILTVRIPSLDLFEDGILLAEWVDEVRTVCLTRISGCEP